MTARAILGRTYLYKSLYGEFQSKRYAKAAGLIIPGDSERQRKLTVLICDL